MTLGTGSFLIRAFLRLGGGLSVEPVGALFTDEELPGERTPLLGIVPGTNGGSPGNGATGETEVEVGVGSGGDVGGVSIGTGAVGAVEGLKALGALLFPQAAAINPSATNKAILG
jgi:hypothetical protein